MAKDHTLTNGIGEIAESVNPRQDDGAFTHLKDASRSVLKRAILRGYCHGALSSEQTQSLIDKLQLNEA
jgi:hypothetical protein